VKSFSIPYQEAINIFLQTTPPSVTLQGCGLATVPMGFLLGFHSPRPGSFQPKQEQMQILPKPKGCAEFSGQNVRYTVLWGKGEKKPTQNT